VGAREARFAVVDEGPGLSGSSFAAAIRLLEECGAPPDRIHAFPSHDGDLGAEAGPERRERWSRAARHVISTDALLLESGRLQAWAEALVGPATGPLKDISGGAWRTRSHPDEAAWPPVNAAQERRKFLVRTADSAWLLKFAGLGRIGERKLQRARALHAAGFSPEPAGLVHGFLVERWCGDARPLSGSPGGDHLAAYLGFRDRSFPAEGGASLPALFEMALANTAEALGDAAAEALEPFRPSAALAATVRPMEIDGRLHRWEWLVTPGGTLLKADALDHHAAHDLVGPQDIAWDVAGAEAEFDLDPDETERLRTALAVEPEMLAVYRPAYLAFQLGWWSMAADAQAGWPAEAARLAVARDRYAARLHRLLDA
jgi:hypothetical protein